MLLASVTMRNVHIRMDRDPDPFSVVARVNATRILISIVVNRNLDHDPISLLQVNGVLDSMSHFSSLTELIPSLLLTEATTTTI